MAIIGNVLCEVIGYDTTAIMPGVFETVPGPSINTMGIVDDLDLAVTYPIYARNNAYATSSILTTDEANLRIEDGVLVADGFCIIGDMAINPEGKMVVASGPDPILADLLAYSYAMMNKAAPWISLASTKVAYLMLRFLKESQPPSLTMKEVNGVSPYVL